jgi:hypothetical protein
MHDALVVERIKGAYLRPIRSVLVVDDDFHQYDAEKPGKDAARAQSLWRACRDSGYLCDIDDGADLLNDQSPEHIGKSDLIILDYHLQGDNPKWALQLLCRLATSDHANIVVVYTKDSDLAAVRTKIAAHLRGGLAAGSLCASPEIQSEWDRVESNITQQPTTERFELFLSGNLRACKTDDDLLEELKTLDVPAPLRPGVAEAFYESLLLKQLADSAAARTTTSIQLGGGTNETPHWVYASNLFVACVQKTADNLKDGAQVFIDLEVALCDWKPDFMVSAVAYARAEFARGGFQLERLALSDQKLKSGWLFHAWSGSADEQTERLRALFERLISSYSSRVLNEMIEFGTAQVPQCETPNSPIETLKSAIKHFCGEQKDLENSVIHALNEFLVMEDIPRFVETGTIFSRLSDGDVPSDVYVCVTPACDLVPRQPRVGTWEHKLHPSRAVIAIRAIMTDATRVHLSKAEENRMVFLRVAGKIKAITLVGEKPPVPTLEWLFLENMGRITDGKLFAMEVGKPTAESGEASHPSLNFAPTEMKALGQIRAIYSSRILQYAGQHLARIGVDFVSYPTEPTAEKPTAAPAANVPQPKT